MTAPSNCSGETLPVGRVSKIIQIHPSLHCNLFCKHCYSSSAPALKGGLAVERLIGLTEEARELDYNVVSLSGGEPFLYKGLGELMSHTATLGYFNSVTTNAMLVQSASAKKTMKHIHLVAVSVDGQQEQHDDMRGMPGAYKKMLDGVTIIKDNVKAFGFIHTLLPDNWQLMPWLTSFAVEHGAALLHLHPLELTGRAQINYAATLFSPEDLYRIYIAHYYLKTLYANDIFIQLDLLHKDNIINNPNFIFHANTAPDISVNSFSSVFKELIVDEKGDLLPLAHGCSPFFKLGNLADGRSLRQMITQFLERQLEPMMQLYADTYQEILDDTDHEIINWSELVIKNSYRFQYEETPILSS